MVPKEKRLFIPVPPIMMFLNTLTHAMLRKNEDTVNFLMLVPLLI
jgi:hypothetical protein